MGSGSALRAWLAVQGLAVLGGLAALWLVDGLAGHLAAALPNGHGMVKQAMGIVHTVLVRQPQWAPLFAGAAVVALVLPWLPPRAWSLASGLPLLAAALLLDHGNAFLLIPFVAAIVLSSSPHPVPALAWLPGAPLLVPGQVLHALGRHRPGPRAGLSLPSALLVAAAWLVLDSHLYIGRHESQVTWWPEALTEPGAVVLDRAPRGVHCEFHDVDVFDDRIVVVAEGSGRILSFPRSGGAPATIEVPRDWGPWGGLTLDTDSDPRRRRTWLLEGERAVTALDWTPEGLSRAGQAGPLPEPLHHVYTTWLAERQQLVLADVNAKGAADRPKLTVLDGPDLQRIRALPLHTADGSPVPVMRQLAWVPPLQRFVMAPGLGERLYLVDPDNGRAEPWLTVPTANGSLVWEESLGRLFMALPDRLHVWVIDPAGPTVERRIPTQPGVRALAVDAERGLLLAGSVLTGRVWVHRLDDGRVVRRLGGFMPMMRELALLEDEGEAVLTTWGMLYRFSYLPETP